MTTLAEHPFGNMFPQQPEHDDFTMRYPDPPQAVFTTGPVDMSIHAEAYGYPRSAHDVLATPTTMCFDASLYAEAPNYIMNNHASPGIYPEDPELGLPSSSLSTASAPSAASSAIGSPQSNPGHGSIQEWGPPGLSVHPAIVGNDYMVNPEYSGFTATGMEDLPLEFTHSKGFVDPSLIQSEMVGRQMSMHPYDAHFQQPAHSYTPSVSSSPQPTMMRTDSSSPFLHTGPFQTTFPTSPFAAPMDPNVRRPSMSSFISPPTGEYASSDETREKQRCTYPDCGKVFKDLKAHMLTHQNERPEKCPINTCEYHIKGFARKYDKNRHTLTHYKGTMVCGFCPGSGSAAEKSFNRADVFKRHLTAVHGVEQTPPNSRKKTSTAVSSGKKLTGYAPDATGKCSTCSQTFSNAQDFYEHLDDCVLRIVQQEDPAEAINAQHLTEVENDKEVHQTLERNNLPITTQVPKTEDEEEDCFMAEEEEGDASTPSDSSVKSASASKKKAGTGSGVQKSKGMTNSRGGVALNTKTRGRKNRRDYPLSWGFDKGRMTVKKRVLCVFDGARRLAKDDIGVLSADQMVRIKLSDGEHYVTDLDVWTMKRAEAFHGATDEEKGPWISDDPSEEDTKDMLRLSPSM